jgi:hypothetical protein
LGTGVIGNDLQFLTFDQLSHSGRTLVVLEVTAFVEATALNRKVRSSNAQLTVLDCRVPLQQAAADDSQK